MRRGKVAALGLFLLAVSWWTGALARTTWTHETLGAVWAAPLVAPDGTIFVGSEDAILYAFEPGGKTLWSYKASDGWSGWPVWAKEGSLLAVGNRNGSVYFFTPGGDLRSKVSLGSATTGRPAVWRGRIFIGTEGGRLVAIKDGRTLWYHTTGSPVTSFVTVGGGGKVLFGCADGRVFALDQQRGDRLWRTKVGDRKVVGGVAAAKEQVFVASAGGDVVSLDLKSGEIRWRRKLDPLGEGGLASLPSGSLMVAGTLKGALVALGEGGKRLWSFSADAPIRGLATVTARWVLFGTERGTVFVLDHRGRPQGLASTAGAIRGGITLARGRVHVGSADRRLYVFPVPAGPAGRYRWERMAQLKALLKRTPRGVRRWRRELSGPVAAGVARGHKGTLLASTWGNKIFLIDRTGKVLWTHNCGAEILTLPASAPNGDILFGCNDGGFYGLKGDGHMRFRIPVNKVLASSPAVARDGTVYFGARDKRIHAISKTGDIQWRIRTGDDVDSSPRIAPDGVVYVGSDDRHLYAVAPLGNILWYHKVAGAIRSRPAIGRDGAVYFTAMDQRLHAVSKAGSHRWEHQTGGQIVSSPVVLKSGAISFGSRDHGIYSVDPEEGKLRWRFSTAGEVDSSPTVTSQGLLAAGSDDGNLYVLDPEEGTLRWWYPARAEIRGALAPSERGGVVFGTMDGGVVEVAPPPSATDDGPAPTPLLSRDKRLSLTRFRVGRGRVGPLLPLQNGELLVAGVDGVMRAYGPDHWPLWQVRIGEDRLSQIHAVPVDDGERISSAMAVTDSRGDLALIERGRLRFRLRLSKGIPTVPSSVALEKGSLILVGTPAGRLWAVTPYGKVRWFYSGKSAVVAPPAAVGGTILVPFRKELVALDLSGHRRWSNRFSFGILARPTVLKEAGIGLVGDGGGNLRAYDAGRGDPRWELDAGAGIQQSVPVPGSSSAMVLTADARVMEVAATGERLLEVAAPVPPVEIVCTPKGVVYLVGADGSLWRLDRQRGLVTRVLDVAARVLHAGRMGSRTEGLVLVTSDGLVTLLSPRRKPE